MNNLNKKKLFLKNNNFIEIFENAVFINRELKLLFTTEAIEDNNLNQIEKIIENKRNEKIKSEWDFYFSSKPKEAIIKNILNKLGIQECKIHILEQ
jgi:DNA-binding sugar fermentation-stimulating protein